MNIKIYLFKTINSAFLKSSTLLLVFAFSVAVLPPNAFAFLVKTSASADNAEDENFDKKFREGRDLIDKQEWKKAAAKFDEVIKQYPDNKSVDAALYWLAFCYKKQREYEKMGAAVDRLMKDHPSSSWTSDAQVLLIEVAQPAKVIYGAAGQGATFPDGKGGTVTVAGTYSTNNLLKPGQPLAIAPANSADSFAVLSGFYPSEAKIPLEREDEIRLAAFKSLLSADLPKGIKAMNELLKSDSKASDSLKAEVLRSLRRRQLYDAPSSLGLSLTLDSVNSPRVSLLRESLIKSFQNNFSSKIRRELVYTLASLNDADSIIKLGVFYNSESDIEVKKAIINNMRSARSVFGFYNLTDATSTAAKLDNIALSEYKSAVNSNESKLNAARFDKLLEIIRTEKNSELRRFALITAQRFSEWKKSGQISATLIQIYDSETDEAFKKSIIQSLVKANQPQATKKLLEIAKNDKSDALKLEAIRALGQSKDPEAIKYLEEIIK